MYLAGAAHPNREIARSLLDTVIAAGEPIVTDAEVLQEIVHRYSLIGRRDLIPALLRESLRLVRLVFPMTQFHVVRAADILLAAPGVSARGAVHLAVMEFHGVRRILSFDAAFDRWPGIVRVAGSASRGGSAVCLREKSARGGLEIP